MCLCVSVSVHTWHIAVASMRRSMPASCTATAMAYQLTGAAADPGMHVKKQCGHSQGGERTPGTQRHTHRDQQYYISVYTNARRPEKMSPVSIVLGEVLLSIACVCVFLYLLSHCGTAMYCRAP